MEWARGSVIGRGATAAVSLATSISSGEVFAVKSIELSHSSILQKETQILAQLSCSHIVNYLGHDISHENDDKVMYNLFMEYASGGALSDEIKRHHGGRLNESSIRTFTRQIVRGLDYLHMKKLVHCDIKCSNILVDEDGVKIADLGCARLVDGDGECGDSSSSSSVFSGTPVFMAPEVARGEEQSFPADIWALGCTIIEMATGSNNPWPEVNDPISALFRIGFSGDLPEFPKSVSEKGKDFLSKCLVRNPRDRWTAKQLLQHPFLDDDELIIKDCIENSPTCVLDHGFWDSLGESQTPQSEPKPEPSSSNSPAERIGKLIRDRDSALFSSSDVPNWCCWDDNWITVRSNSNGIEEDFNVDELSDSIIHEEIELGELNFNGELFFEDSVEDTSVGEFNFRRAFLMACKSGKFDIVMLFSNLRQIMRKKLLSKISIVSSHFIILIFISYNDESQKLILILIFFLWNSLMQTRQQPNADNEHR